MQGEKSGVAGAFRKLLVLFLLPLVLSGCAGKEMSAFDGEDAPPKAAAEESGAEKTTGGEDNLGAEKLAGTNRRPALSNNDVARGNQPRPADFEGIWFEEEPEDRREHVVWKSQEFVGRPIDLPRISAEKGRGPFVGLPDICSPVVKKRMAKLGYEAGEFSDFSGHGSFSCAFADHRVPGEKRYDVTVFKWMVPHEHLVPAEGLSKYGEPVGGSIVALRSGAVGHSCIAQGDRGFGQVHLFVNAGFDLTKTTREDACKGSQLHWQLLNNILGGEIS